VRGVLQHLNILHPHLGKHLVCAGTILEVDLIVVEHVVVEEVLHVLPGYSGPGPLDGVPLPEDEFGVTLKEQFDPPSLWQIVLESGDHASLIQVGLYKMAQVSSRKRKPPVSHNLNFLQQLEFLLL